MGEYADMVLNGDMCQYCGEILSGNGYAQTCRACSTPIRKKVQHVKRAKQPPKNTHTCHWPGCQKKVNPAFWGCNEHWKRLPKNLRDNIWATYRPGQENDKNPSPRYLEVAKEVDEWCRSQVSA